MSAEPLLAINEVSYAYAGTQVLDRVSLTVQPGHVVARFGGDCAGKSTLLRCAARWSLPASGSIRVLGRDLKHTEWELRRDLTLVADHFPSTFSREMQYKPALVIALAARPRVLLLDEGRVIAQGDGLGIPAEAGDSVLGAILCDVLARPGAGTVA